VPLIRPRLTLVSGLVVGGLLAGSLTAPTEAAEVVTESVTFSVTAVNRSDAPCAADGGPAVVRGRLTVPAAGPAPGAVTLALHGLGASRLFDFAAVPGYDTARELAERGHAVLVVESLGYAPSDRPPGFDVCLGSQADVVHQIVGALRAGQYQAAGGGARRFDRVALVGASFGGLIAELEAHSFADVDALGVMSWADQGFSALAGATFAGTTLDCSTAALTPAETPPGYRYFGRTADDFRRQFFVDAEPAVVDAAYATRPPDPCGEPVSFPQAVLADVAGTPRIRVPVLLVHGTEDALFLPLAWSAQAVGYPAAASVTRVEIEGAGHYLPLERSHPDVTAALSRWLTEQGF
jgi:alpha-beta hydrolase superfamily lysophospholipase